MSHFFSTDPKWTYSDPEKYGLTDPNEGLVCKRCGGSGAITIDKGGRPYDKRCPTCQGRGKP